MSSSHEDVRSLLGAYALDAVEPGEATDIERHLRDCPKCREEVADYREVVSRLAHAGSDAPEGLWERIAANLEEPPPEMRLEVVPSRRQARPAVRARWVIAVAGVAAAVIAALGVEIGRLNNQVGNLQSAVSDRGMVQVVNAALADPHHTTVRLVSGNQHRYAEVVVRPDGAAYLVRANLPALGPKRTYQLWASSNLTPVSIGLLGSHPSMSAFRVAPGTTQLMVTAEPVGGVASPTPPVLLQGSVPVRS